MDAVLIEEQPGNFVFTCQHRFAEPEGSTRGGGLRWGKDGDREVHGSSSGSVVMIRQVIEDAKTRKPAEAGFPDCITINRRYS